MSSLQLKEKVSPYLLIVIKLLNRFRRIQQRLLWEKQVVVKLLKLHNIFTNLVSLGILFGLLIT